MMSESDQRRLIMLFCIQCSNGNETLHDEEVTFLLRINAEDWAATKALFISKNFINAENLLMNWSKRQFLSDSSTERVRKHREAKNAERNVSVTPPDTDTDTEKEKKKPLRNAEQHAVNAEGFAEFWKRYPRKKNKGDAEKAWKKLSPDAGLVSAILEAVEVAQASDDWRKDAGRYVPYPASWLNAKGWLDEARPAAYSADEIAVVESYNRILGSLNWPEGVLSPYSPERAVALREFIGFGKKPGWVDAYFGFIAESLEARAGCGLDWAIRRETYLRCREGNFSALREAA